MTRADREALKRDRQAIRNDFKKISADMDKVFDGFDQVFADIDAAMKSVPTGQTGRFKSGDYVFTVDPSGKTTMIKASRPQTLWQRIWSWL